MIYIEKELQEKKEELEKIIKFIEKKQSKHPKGSLRISKDRKHYSFYHYVGEQREKYPGGKYIPKEEKKTIQALAQKDYDLKVLEWARECRKKLEKFSDFYKDNKLLELYDELGAVRMELVTPYELPDDLYAQKWQSVSCQGKPFDVGAGGFLTENKERVRSKSEKILADTFLRMGIPYKYECPLALKGYKTVYPDFTILNKRTRQIWYWEHLGMMDNAEYVQKSVMKIHTYAKNKIFVGKQLLISHEMKNELDFEEINGLIQEFLI